MDFFAINFVIDIERCSDCLLASKTKLQLITSTEKVMVSPVFVCVFVWPSVCLLAKVTDRVQSKFVGRWTMCP